MLKLKTTVDYSGAVSSLENVVRRARKMSAAFDKLRKPLRDDQREHAKQQAGPDGKWAPRAASTIAAIRARKRKRIKGSSRVLGKLPITIVVKSAGSSVTAYSPVRWAGIHQYGGTAGRGARIPARPFLWISDHMLAIARTELVDHCLAGWPPKQRKKT